MIELPTPPVPDLARAEGHTRDEMVRSLLSYYKGGGAIFNYISGTLSVKRGYQGLHNISQLVAGTDKEKIKQGRDANAEIVRLAAPVAFGRRTQVFDLAKRRFAFGRDLHAGYRIPFFFVENGIVKLYFLQPRKSFNLTLSQMSMVATIHKRFLLDTEFYGQPADVEYVDVSADAETGVRKLNVMSLSDLELWSDTRLSDRLTLISEAIEFIKANHLVAPRQRQVKKTMVEMPLFD